MITGDDLRDTRLFVLRETQQELADRMGVSLRTVGTWEREGVPERREYVVTRSIGEQLASWVLVKESMDGRPTPEWEDLPEEERRYIDEQQKLEDREAAVFAEVRAENNAKRRRTLLEEFTDDELISELRHRLSRFSGQEAGSVSGVSSMFDPEALGLAAARDSRDEDVDFD